MSNLLIFLFSRYIVDMFVFVGCRFFLDEIGNTDLDCDIIADCFDHCSDTTNYLKLVSKSKRKFIINHVEPIV